MTEATERSRQALFLASRLDRRRCYFVPGSSRYRMSGYALRANPTYGLRAQRRPVCARQRHGGENRQVAWWLGETECPLKQVGATGANPGGARSCYAPDAQSSCGRDRPAPSIIPRPRPGKPWSAGSSGKRQNAPWRLAGMITVRAPRHTRKPMLFSRLSRALSLRFAARQIIGLLFHAPPRSTRDTFQAAPQAEAGPSSMAGRA